MISTFDNVMLETSFSAQALCWILKKSLRDDMKEVLRERTFYGINAG